MLHLTGWPIPGQLPKKVQVGNDQEMAQSEGTKMTLRYVYQENIVSRVSSYSPIGGHSLARTELKI